MFPIYYLSYNFIRKNSFITFFSAYKSIPCNYLTIKLLAIFEAIGPFLFLHLSPLAGLLIILVCIKIFKMKYNYVTFLLLCPLSYIFLAPLPTLSCPLPHSLLN